MERVWGGRRLETLFGKRLPPATLIGESWEIVDRPEAQSVVHNGPNRGTTLHELWTKRRAEIFGKVADTPRFPILVKLLDARQKLSVQVHPPANEAERLGGEAKTEFWYIAEAAPAAELFVGLAAESTPETFAAAIDAGNVADHVHRIAVQTGDAMFLPSGRVHAIGAGNVIIEIQQNSDTTYRVFDWNRKSDGAPRELHIEESLACIDFADVRPSLAQPDGETFVRHDAFCVERWKLDRPRRATNGKSFTILCGISGSARCGGQHLGPGQFMLVPACLDSVDVEPTQSGTELLAVTAGV